MRCPLALLVALALVLLPLTFAQAEEPEAPTAEETARHEREAKEHDGAGRHAEAVAAWKKVLAARPGDQWVKLSLARSLLGAGTSKSLQQAEKQLVALLEFDWQHPTRGDVRYQVDDTLASVLWCRAEEVEGKGRAGLLARAITAWERVLAARPQSPGALIGLARANLALGRDEAGLDYAERYLAMCHDSMRRWEQQRSLWQARLGQAATPAQMRVFSEKVEGARRQAEDVTLLIAGAHMRRKEPKKALARYDSLIDPGPASAAAYFGRAEAHVALKQLEKAVEDLERCLELATDASAATLRKRAEELLARCRKR